MNTNESRNDNLSIPSNSPEQWKVLSPTVMSPNLTFYEKQMIGECSSFMHIKESTLDLEVIPGIFNQLKETPISTITKKKRKIKV